MKGRYFTRQKYDLATGEFYDHTEYFLDNQPVSREEFKQAFPEGPMGAVLGDGSRAPEFEPIHSESQRYHPRQRQEATEYLKKIGVPTEIDSMGRCVFRDRQHRRAYLKATGKIDLNSYAGY